MKNTLMETLSGVRTPLRFVESEEHYSVYVDQDGEEVLLGPGGRRLTWLSEVHLDSTWHTWRNAGGIWWQTSQFEEHLRSLVADPDEVAETIGFCVDCHRPDDLDDQEGTGNGSVCSSCIDNYAWCESGCEQRWAVRSMTTTLADEWLCENCRVRYSYCDACEGWHHDNDASEHNHGGAACRCESPAQSFSIRNDGEEPLQNDVPVTIQLPAGVITDEGIGAIANLLRQHSNAIRHENNFRDVDAPDRTVEIQKIWEMAYNLSEIGEAWQTKQGNYTKRLSRWAYKERGVKLPPEIISQVGCIARDHSTAIDFEIEVTRNLNLSAEAFGHEESCWWQSYSESRCSLKSNGGFGIRTFTEFDYGGTSCREVSGRAWVMPLRRVGNDLKPTFETLKPDAFVVFNGYGNLSGYTAARIISHMAGMTYRKIGFTCPPMYINSEAGYLVAPEDIASKYADGRLDLGVEFHSNLFTRETERVLTNA